MTAHDSQIDRNILCPTCCKGRMHPQRVTERFPYELDGETATVVAENVPVEVCDNCGEQLSGPEAARIRHEAICRALGLLTPAEIRAIRERLGMTQEQFNKLTRIGEATICRWERGRLLQNAAMDRYLRLIAASEENVRILQEFQDPNPTRNGTPDAPLIPGHRATHGSSLMDKMAARDRLLAVVRVLAAEKRQDLEQRKQRDARGLARPDFVWHYLLQSYATQGRASGSRGLIDNQDNYRRVTYDALAALSSDKRDAQVRQVCRAAKIRMPDRKADWILRAFEYTKGTLGGLEAAKATLLAQPGRDAKIRFLKSFPGIGPKYARNIMMDVYHEDFRDSIALDSRIIGISEGLGLSFESYAEHEAFYLDVARQAGLNGWELDRLLFNFEGEMRSRLGIPKAKTGRRSRSS